LNINVTVTPFIRVKTNGNGIPNITTCQSTSSIAKENLWLEKDIFFPEIIVFCPEIEQQIKTIDRAIFGSAISILRAVERNQKKTGALLGCAVKLGALVSESCSEQDICTLECFAKNIGLA
jgi:hypothetical protein